MEKIISSCEAKIVWYKMVYTFMEFKRMYAEGKRGWKVIYQNVESDSLCLWYKPKED